MSAVQILMASFVLLSMVLVLLTPSQVKSTYHVEEGFRDGWLLIQSVTFFGLRWRKSWFVDVPRGAWVDMKTDKPVTPWRSEWLTNLVQKWQEASYKSIG